MARADLLIELVRAGAEGNQELFRRALEALITEERSKQHHVLADRLAAHLQLNGYSKPTAAIAPVSLPGAACFLPKPRHQRRIVGQIATANQLIKDWRILSIGLVCHSASQVFFSSH